MAYAAAISSVNGPNASAAAWSGSGDAFGGPPGFGAPPLGQPPTGSFAFAGAGTIGQQGLDQLGAAGRVLQQETNIVICICGTSGGCRCQQDDPLRALTDSTRLLTDQLQQNVQSQNLNSMVQLLLGLLQNGGGAKKKKKKKKGGGGAKAVAGPNGASATA